MGAAHVDLNLVLLARVDAHVAATTAHQLIRLLSSVELAPPGVSVQAEADSVCQGDMMRPPDLAAHRQERFSEQ